MALKILELDYQQLPLMVKIHGKAKTKTYILKSSSRKLAACLIKLEEPLFNLISGSK